MVAITAKQLNAGAAAFAAKHPLNTVVTAVQPNAKRGFSRACYACYKVGGTIGQYTEAIAALGAPPSRTYRDLYWDVTHGFITLAAPGTADATAKGNAPVPAIWAGKVTGPLGGTAAAPTPAPQAVVTPRATLLVGATPAPAATAQALATLRATVK